MPHIILEYSKPLAAEINIQELLDTLHASLGAQDGVELERIKSRALPLESYSVGVAGKSGQMVHITLLLLEGRDAKTKQRYAQPLHRHVCDAVCVKYPDAAITLEVRDLDTATYIK